LGGTGATGRGAAGTLTVRTCRTIRACRLAGFACLAVFFRAFVELRFGDLDFIELGFARFALARFAFARFGLARFGFAEFAFAEADAWPLPRLARRASRNFRISDLGRSLCFAQTIPKTGAARLLHPGTGQSWIGALRRFRTTTGPPSPAPSPARSGSTAERRPGGLPLRLPLIVRLVASPPENAERIVWRARETASCSISVDSCVTKSPTI
jgi:hypothetical protein